MDKKELKKRLEEKVAILKTQCKDAKFADKLIDDLLSLKGQIDVNADERKVISEIKQGAYRITLYDDDNIEYEISGFKAIIKPYLNVYGFPFMALLNCHDNYDSLNDEEKANYEQLLINVVLMMQMPTIVFSNPQMFESVLVPYVEELNKSLKDAENPDNLPEDDEAKNEEFAKEMEFKEELKKELDDTKK